MSVRRRSSWSGAGRAQDNCSHRAKGLTQPLWIARIATVSRRCNFSKDPFHIREPRATRAHMTGCSARTCGARPVQTNCATLSSKLCSVFLTRTRQPTPDAPEPRPIALSCTPRPRLHNRLHKPSSDTAEERAPSHHEARTGDTPRRRRHRQRPRHAGRNADVAAIARPRVSGESVSRAPRGSPAAVGASVTAEARTWATAGGSAVIAGRSAELYR
jgi:hypothetical protein